MLLHVSFTGILLGILLSSVSLRESIAHAQQSVDIGTLPDVADMILEGGQEHHKEISTAAAATRSTKLPRGRKMGAEDVVKKEVMKVKGAAEKNSGANPSVGRCDHQGDEGEVNVGCELSDHRSLPSGGVNLDHFIPFSSDYRGAKTHPPKNN